ncbi:MAG TPA: caspase family protein [Chitinophagaceae bacterium]
MFRLLPALIFFYFSLAPSISFSQAKRALLVAVGNYPVNSGCPPIASVNDLKYIRETLKKRDFPDINIAELRDSKATKAAITRALDGLAKKAGKNDVIVIFFGCHGQQIRDQRTAALGKDEADGYDEALLPYDAKSQYSPGEKGYRGENHLRDDELGKKLTTIRNAIGPNGSLLVLLDACHSGTGTRGDDEFAVYRGEPVPFPDPEQPADSLISLSGAADENSFLGDESDTASNMVVISGSGPNQKNYQTIDPSIDPKDPKRKVGSLTYAFAKAMADLPPDADYQLLFDRIKAKIQADHPMQLPMIEGRANQEIFNGRYKTREDKIILKQGVRDLDLRGDSVFTIDKGTLHNISVGATCKINVANSKELFAAAIIRKTGNFFSIGVSSRPLKKGEAYEVKMDAVNYGEFSASLLIKVKDNKSAQAKLLEKQLKEFVQPLHFLSLVSSDADMMMELVTGNNGNVTMNLIDIGDSILWAKQVNKDDTLTGEEAKDLLGSIKNFIRVRYLRSLVDGGDLAAKVSAKIFSRDNPGKEEPELVLKARERYLIKMDYNTDTTLYYTIINILPNNKVKVLIPDGSRDPAEYSIKGTGPKEIRLRVDSIAVPGREVFKIILSKEPLYLKSIFERKSTRAGGMLSFEEAIDDMFKDGEDQQATRSDISNVKVEEIGILTVGFTIKK